MADISQEQVDTADEATLEQMEAGLHEEHQALLAKIAMVSEARASKALQTADVAILASLGPDFVARLREGGAQIQEALVQAEPAAAEMIAARAEAAAAATEEQA
jgi:hypothetical protein